MWRPRTGHSAPWPGRWIGRNRTSGRNHRSRGTLGARGCAVPSSPIRSRPSRPPSVTGSGPASRRRPTRRPAAGRPSRSGSHTLIHAPTGSGKTLAAFLWCLDRLATHPTPGADPRGPGRGPRPVRLAAQGPDLRHRAEPPGAAHGDRPGGRAAGRRAAAHHGRQPDRRHARRGSAPDRPSPARHPDHDARVAVPDAHQRRARGPARRRVRHRRRGPRDRRLEARRAPRAQPRAARGAAAPRRRRPAHPADRAVRHATAARDDRAASWAGSGADREVTIVDAGARKPLELQVVVPVDDMAAIGELLPPEDQPGGPAAQRGPPDEHLAGDPPARSSSSSAATTARSCSPTAGGCPSASPSGSTSWPARSSSAPTTGASPASSGSQIEEELKAGRLPALVATSSLELGIDMGAVDLVIQVESPTSVARGPPADRPRRAPGRRAREGRDLPEVPRRPARMRGRHPPDARGRDRDDHDPAQPARRPRPAARRDDRHGSLDRGRAARRSSPARRRTRR